MANIEDCPGFETFGADVKAARKAKHMSKVGFVRNSIYEKGLKKMARA